MGPVMRGSLGRARRAGWVSKATLVLGLGAVAALGVRIAAAEDPACDPASIQDRVAALEAKYDAMPEATSAEEQYQRSQRFEEEWKALGELCERPNGMGLEPPLGPEDHVLKLDPPGITSPAPPGQRESYQPGDYEVVNRWLGYVDGQPVVVSAVIQTTEIDGGVTLERRWGLLVQTPGQVGVSQPDTTPRPGFYGSPKGVGPLTIVAERDLVLTLEGPDGERLAFDVARGEWVEP